MQDNQDYLLNMIKITNDLLDQLSFEASISPRKRKNYNFHKEDSDCLQRMLNALEPGTYIRPHKHINPGKREVFILLKGIIAVLEFDDRGNITDHIILDRDKGNYATEITLGAWHTALSLEKGSVYYEVKDGPYDAAKDKIFANWSPEESSENAPLYLKNIINKII